MTQGKRPIRRCVACYLAMLFAAGFLHGCSSGGSPDAPSAAAGGNESLNGRTLAAVDISAVEGEWRGLSRENQLYRSDLVLRKSGRGGALEGEVQYGLLNSGKGSY